MSDKVLIKKKEVDQQRLLLSLMSAELSLMEAEAAVERLQSQIKAIKEKINQFK
jgi:CII-binding regulator of phage lambda lysogenization HflD